LGLDVIAQKEARMIRWLALALLALAAVTTPAPSDAAVTYACTRSNIMISADAYIVHGKCTATGTYSTAGDAVGASASVGDTAAVLCGSAARVLQDAVFGGGTVTAGTTASLAVFDHTTRLLQHFGGAAATALLTELAAGVDISTFIYRFVATCK
jgi:hypothetical protein